MLRSYEALVYTLANRVVSCASIRFALRKFSITVTAELAGWPGMVSCCEERKGKDKKDW